MGAFGIVVNVVIKVFYVEQCNCTFISINNSLLAYIIILPNS